MKNAIEFTDDSCKELALAMAALTQFQQHIYKAAYNFDEAEKINKIKDCPSQFQLRVQVLSMFTHVQLKSVELEALLSIRDLGRMIDRGMVVIEAENFNAETTNYN